MKSEKTLRDNNRRSADTRKLRTKLIINRDSVLSDSVCYYTPCLDQYKNKCTYGNAWKTCDNRQTDR